MIINFDIQIKENFFFWTTRNYAAKNEIKFKIFRMDYFWLVICINVQ